MPGRMILRTSGAVEALPGPLSMAELCSRIGADLPDTVRLAGGYVMLVNDRGYETKPVESVEPDGTHVVELRVVRALLPLNVEATRLYHGVCRPGTTHQIVGDVAVVPDSDFA